MKALINLFLDLLLLWFPRNCAACNNSLFRHEEIICMKCRLHLPKTDFHEYDDNPVHRVFWGRVKLDFAASCFYYIKESKLQTLIHKLKYQNHKEIGIYLGKYYGQILKNLEKIQQMDVIMPVPLHRKKLHKRGYNQSELIANGISEITGISVNTKILKRSTASSTQTRKSRYERWENVSNIFYVSGKENLLKGKNILLVDDVLTTGATLEACLQALKKANYNKIGLVTLAYAK